jgi:hypothetical protein
MEKTETYRGHKIVVTVEKVRMRAWNWAYGIDREVFSKSVWLLPDEETALHQGLGAARARVDEMEG